ncbi:hypothetical protein ACWEQL_01575 [Kitasatospora sp. NPDC004240]
MTAATAVRIVRFTRSAVLAAAALVCLALVVPVVLGAGADLPHTTRLVGTPGLMSVEQCAPDRSGTPAGECAGGFRPDEPWVGETVAAFVYVELVHAELVHVDPRVEVGARIPVQCEGAYCHRVGPGGPGGTARALMLPTLCLALVSVGAILSGLASRGFAFGRVTAFRARARGAGGLCLLLGLFGPIVLGLLGALLLSVGW